ncbi:MAG: serine--tRNA ligase [Candidatus Pacearchaeota archaeon]|nr:serine--tRNA ligase [Candidatus Pacearchaeota archaeon]
MLDPKFIRENPEKVRNFLAKRKEDYKIVDEWLEKDKIFRESKAILDSLRHERNVLSEQINALIKNGKQQEAKEKIEESRKIAKKIKILEEDLRNKKKEFLDITFKIPNIVSEEVPEEEKLILEYGKINKKKWQKSYVELLSKKLDFDSAASMSGEGFFVLYDEAAILLRALINFCLDVARKKYREVCVPVLLKERAVFNSAHLPRFKDGMYSTTEGLYLSPTEEVALLNLYANKIIEKKELPLCFTAYTPSFRTEKGATKGLIRVHQFDEVELFKFTTQEDSTKELKKMVEDASEVLKLLNLPFRIKLLPAYEIAAQSSITYDIEVFSPVTGWLEVSSCSNCLDYQARRARIFYLDKGERKLVHTLNGTCLGLQRVFIALLENYQKKDGSIAVPKVLQRYTNFKIIKKA